MLDMWFVDGKTKADLDEGGLPNHNITGIDDSEESGRVHIPLPTILAAHILALQSLSLH